MRKSAWQWTVILGAVFCFVALTMALIYTRVLIDVDLRVRAAVEDFVPDWAQSGAGYATHLGQGGPLALIVGIIAVVLSVRGRVFKPLLLWGMTFISLFVILGTIKTFMRRGAPADPLANAVELFSKPFCGGPACLSYPSGHVVSSIVWYGLLIILLGHMINQSIVYLLSIAPVVVTTIATVLSGYHWLTDSLAAIFLGVALIQTLRLITPRIPELPYPAKATTSRRRAVGRRS